MKAHNTSFNFTTALRASVGGADARRLIQRYTATVNRLIFIVILSLAILTSCALPISDAEQNNIAEAVVLAYLDTLYTWVDREDIEWDSRVFLVSGQGVNEAVRDKMRQRLRPPFQAVRSDSSEIKVTYETAYTEEGKAIQYTAMSRDRLMDVPIRGLYVDSIQVQRPGVVTALLYEADVEGTHYQGLKWWLKRSEAGWRVDSMRVTWIN